MLELAVEHEKDNTILILRTLVSRKPDGTLSLSFNVYRKHTHTDQYLYFTSLQPL